LARAFNISPHRSSPGAKRTDTLLGSGLIDYIQKMIVAAMQIAEKKVWAHRS
jgi:hypothetical protein